MTNYPGTQVAAPADVRGYGWVLTEDVRVTLISRDDEYLAVQVLVERRTAPGALVLGFDEDRVTINGLYATFSDDELPLWNALADAVLTGPATAEPGEAVTTRAIAD